MLWTEQVFLFVKSFNIASDFCPVFLESLRKDIDTKQMFCLCTKIIVFDARYEIQFLSIFSIFFIPYHESGNFFNFIIRGKEIKLKNLKLN